MATSTTPQPYTADRPENSTTSVDASVGLPLYRSLARWMFSRSPWSAATETACMC